MTLSAEDWIRRFSKELGTSPPNEDELTTLLALVGVAAHASERTAAPITCWLAARAGVAPDDALAAANRLAAQLGPDAG